MSVGLFDAIIRTFYRVCEFTDDPACVLRVGLSPARAPVSLSDGTRVEIGGLVGTLHFGISICHALGPADPTPLGLRSAKPGPAFASCAGLLCRERTRFAADTGASRRGRTVNPARDSQVQRVAERFGFERVPTNFSRCQRLYALGESCTLWALTRAFNPAAVSRQPFLRDHHELWISRAELLGRYGRPRRSSGTNRPDELIAGSADDFAGGQLAK